MGGKLTEAQKKATKKYDATNTRQYHLKLNLKTDADIIQWLDKQDSMQGYIKDLIRADMEEQELLSKMAKRTQAIEDEISGMQVQLVDDYRDEDAIKVCMDEGHRIYVGRHDWFEYRIDVDAKKVLCCYDIRNKYQFLTGF